MKTKSTNIGSRGGIFEGPSHAEGGIPVVVKSTGQPIEVEGGEIIINKQASKLHCAELSKINQSAGNGVAIPCESDSWDGLKIEKAEVGAKIPSLINSNLQKVRHKGNVIVWINPVKLLEATKSDLDFSLLYAKNHIGNRLQKAKDFINSYHEDNRFINPRTNERMNSTRISFEPSIVYLDDNNVPHFEDGRHRLLASAELGMTSFPIEVSKDQASKFADLFPPQFKNGGKTDSDIYKRWSELVNMSKSELQKFYESKEGQDAGLGSSEAKDLGIKSGRESARWIMKMKDTNWHEWTPEMWKWAMRQISFISRMSGNKGPLYDDKGNKTRKHTSLLIWGHNPEKHKQFGLGGISDYNQLDLGLHFDEIVESVESKYVDEADKIINLASSPDIEPSREALRNWVTNESENVKVIIAFSGGKDSVAMVLNAMYNLHIPKERIELWHHEVDGYGEKLFDWQCTHSYCQAFADALGLKILFSYRQGGIARSIQKQNETEQPIFFQSEPGGEFNKYVHATGTKDNPTKFLNTRNRFPAVGANLQTRWCSANVKIEVMARAITHIEAFDKGNFVIMTGERRLESKARSNYNEIEPYINMSKNRRAITWRSIIDWTEEQVWDIMKEHKIQPHPCYELGWGRCSCQLCIFSDPDTWASLTQISPEKVDRIAELEAQNAERGSKQPTLYADSKGSIGIKEWIIKKKGESFIEKSISDRWLKEALGEFTSPIIIEDWKLPKGAFNGQQQGAN